MIFCKNIVNVIPLLYKKVTFLTHKHHITQKKLTFYFYNIYEYVNVFIFIENEK